MGEYAWDQNGKPGNHDELVMFARCCSQAFMHILKPNVGIIVELEFQNKYPLDPCGKFFIYNEKNLGVKIFKIDSNHPLNNYKSGQMVSFDK